jgi:HTH-type transcriptional regulator/antitoxin HigA
MTNNFDPDWYSAPGDTIQELLQERSISLEEFSLQILETPADAEKLLSGELPLTDSIAERLSSVLGSSKEFWQRREELYRERQKRLDG